MYWTPGDAEENFQTIFSASNPHTESLAAKLFPRSEHHFVQGCLAQDMGDTSAPAMGNVLKRTLQSWGHPDDFCFYWITWWKHQDRHGKGAVTAGDPFWQVPMVGKSADRHQVGHLLPGQWCGNTSGCGNQGATWSCTASPRVIVFWHGSKGYFAIVRSAGGIYRRKNKD